MPFGDFKFHGSFTDKEKAKRKERSVKGFIKVVKVRGATRYAVITRKKGR